MQRGVFHCMHKVRSGFRSRLQNAESQRHAAVVAQREVGGQAVVGHPAGRGPGEPVGRGTAFQPHGFDLPQGKGLPQTGACRFQERLLGGKIGGGALLLRSCFYA